MIGHSSSEGSTIAAAAADRPTVKVKPDHLLKKPLPPEVVKSSPSSSIRESDLRRIRILTGGGTGRKLAVRDRTRRLTNGESAASPARPMAQPPALPPLAHAPPPPQSRLTGQRHQVIFIDGLEVNFVLKVQYVYFLEFSIKLHLF